MKLKHKPDLLLNLTSSKIQEELNALLGGAFKLCDNENKIVSKNEFFSMLSGDKIVCKVDIVGWINASSGIFVNMKDAIRLGNHLIMLTPKELDEVVENEIIQAETKNAYVEIVDIIANAMTVTFEEYYQKKVLFVKKDLEIISPLKVEIESDEPVPDQSYYWVSAAMVLNNMVMGNLDYLIPTEFGVS